jgi:hypothetical protein
MHLLRMAASVVRAVLASCVGNIIFILIMIAVSLLVGAIMNWFVLVFLIPPAIVCLALYLNFGQRSK